MSVTRILHLTLSSLADVQSQPKFQVTPELPSPFRANTNKSSKNIAITSLCGALK